MKANKFTRSDDGYTEIIPLVLAIVIVFALLYVGVFVIGAIHENLDESMNTDATARAENTRTRGRLNNTSDNLDDAVDIIQVTIIITVLATAIGAIFMFTRFR